MSGECQKCGEHCLDCKCGINFTGANLHEMIEGVVSGLDSSMRQIYNTDCEAGSKEWHYNHGCVFAFSLCIGILETCLKLEDRKIDRK